MFFYVLFWFVLSFGVADELSKTLIRSYSALGYTIQLTCEVDGNPQKYEWLRNGGKISQHHWLTNGNRSLVILTDLTGECGTYTCVATNPVSSPQANYTINLPGISSEDSIIITASISGLVVSLVCLGGSLLLRCLEKKRASLSLMIFRVLSLAATFVALASWIGIKGANFIPTVALCMVSVRLLAIVAPVVIQKSSCLFTEEFQEKKDSHPSTCLKDMTVILILVSILMEEIQQSKQSCHTSIYTRTVPAALIVGCVTVILVFLATYRYRIFTPFQARRI
ncbi:uncharacterized protein [Hemitrygon akajei]|uniref:uncharacterized protein isoform X2 n=1 Tax=Hemitrygon akajei TaxID=2704970 RepID=UPI003BF9E415